MQKISWLNQQILKVDSKDSKQILKLKYLRDTYEYLLKQRVRLGLKDTYLEYTARFINADLEYQKYLVYLNDKYPELRGRSFTVDFINSQFKIS